MNSVSPRYVPGLIVILAIFSALVFLRSQGSDRVDDCSQFVQLLLPPADGRGMVAHSKLDESVALKRSRWLEAASPEGEWVEGTSAAESSARIVLNTLILRSYQTRLLYHLPEARFGPGSPSEGRHLTWVERKREEPVPIHVVDYAAARGNLLAEYILIYRGRPVANPYGAYFRRAPIQLIFGTEPMTLLMVWGEVPGRPTDAIRGEARTWLLDALARYDSVCG